MLLFYTLALLFDCFREVFCTYYYLLMLCMLGIQPRRAFVQRYCWAYPSRLVCSLTVIVVFIRLVIFVSRAVPCPVVPVQLDVRMLDILCLECGDACLACSNMIKVAAFLRSKDGIDMTCWTADMTCWTAPSPL